MIKSKIAASIYSNHVNAPTYLNSHIYVVDYSHYGNPVKGYPGTQFLPYPPNNIEALKIINNTNLEICCLRYTNNSFSPFCSARQYNSQCEGSAFPNISNRNSWILFTELKYCQSNNDANINKARRQLYKTRYYYKYENIISQSNTCYLIISLPIQKMPYSHTVFTPEYLQQLKLRHNIIMRAVDSVEILDSEMLFVE